jgi:hypothetical protein
MVAGGHSFANSHRSRAWEIMRSGANERGRGGDSIPYLTYHGDASWWPNFAGEESVGGSVSGYSWAAALLFLVAALGIRGGAGGGGQGEGAAQGEELAAARQGKWWRWQGGAWPFFTRCRGLRMHIAGCEGASLAMREKGAQPCWMQGRETRAQGDAGV